MYKGSFKTNFISKIFYNFCFIISSKPLLLKFIYILMTMFFYSPKLLVLNILCFEDPR